MKSMSSVDASAEIEIAADPADIAAVMFDPARTPEWMAHVERVRVIDPALAGGARVEHAGRFLDRAIGWTTAVEAVHFPHLLALRIADGPFAGLVRYEIQRSGGGSRVRIRTVGAPGALDGTAAAPMQAALAADLDRLKALVEAA